MRLTFQKGVYCLQGAAEPPEGWTKRGDVYVSSQKAHAAKYLTYADVATSKRLASYAAAHTEAIAASHALDADIAVPAPDGHAYRPYQLAGIKYMLARHSSLNADAPRLGKMIQALGVSNAMGAAALPMLVVCPAKVKTEWMRGAASWLVKRPSIAVIDGTRDTLSADVTIINYDVLYAYKEPLHARKWGLVAYDESHALKSEKSQRTKVVLGDARGRDEVVSLRRLFLTGTPIFTRPIDLFTTCRACDPAGLGKSYYNFARRYCGALDGDEFDPTGASHLEELQARMRKKFMIRREKRDVIDEIPNSNQDIIVPSDKFNALIRSERAAVVGDDARSLMDILEDWGDATPVSEELASVRQEMALLKIPFITEHVDGLLDYEPKVVIFAHHRAVVQRLADNYPGAARIMGGMTSKQADAERLRFDQDPNCRVLVANITAGGVGVSFAAADVAVYAEMSWSPAEMIQSGERIWLPTKTRPIALHRIIVADSLDDSMRHVIDRRIARTNTAMNWKHLYAAA